MKKWAGKYQRNIYNEFSYKESRLVITYKRDIT